MLQFAEQHPRNPRVLRDKLDVCRKNLFQCFQRRGAIQDGGIHTPEQMLGHPLHDRAQYRFLGWKMTKQGTLSQPHPLRNRGGRDVVRVLLGGQFDDGFNGDGTSFICRKMFCVSLHARSVGFGKLVGSGNQVTGQVRKSLILRRLSESK